jgi:integrase
MDSSGTSGGSVVRLPLRFTTPHHGLMHNVRSEQTRSNHGDTASRFTGVGGGQRGALRRLATASAPERPKHLFSVFADEWLESKRKIRRSTRERYRGSLDLWLLPRLGDLELADVDVDRVAELIVEMEEAGASPASILNHLKPLNGVFKLAVRRGLIAQNPISLLTVDERPRVERKELRVLEPAEIAALLRAAGERGQRKQAKYDYALLLRTAVFTGLRLGELLGLQWRDLDQGPGVLHVRRQVTPRGEITEPKTTRARRRVVLAPDLVVLLVEHRRSARATGRGGPIDFVFASKTGRPLSSRNVVHRGFEPAVEDAKLKEVGKPKLRFHDLRHCFASMMIDLGLSSTDVAAQLGHANSGITERIYIHQFNSQRTHERLRQAAQRAMSANQGIASRTGDDGGRPPSVR